MAKRADTSGLNAEFVISQAKPENRVQGNAPTPYNPSASEPPQDTEPAPESAPVPAMPPAAELETEPQREIKEPPKRKRGQAQAAPQDYFTLFLHEVAITARSGKTVYICQRHHDKIADILHTIAKKEVSLFSYIYNVLEHHFNTFDEELNELYFNNLKQRLKSWDGHS